MALRCSRCRTRRTLCGVCSGPGGPEQGQYLLELEKPESPGSWAETTAALQVCLLTPQVTLGSKQWNVPGISEDEDIIWD